MSFRFLSKLGGLLRSLLQPSQRISLVSDPERIPAARRSFPRGDAHWLHFVRGL